MRRLVVSSLTAVITVLGVFGFISIMCVLSGRTFDQLMGFPFSWGLVAFVFVIALGYSFVRWLADARP